MSNPVPNDPKPIRISLGPKVKRIEIDGHDVSNHVLRANLTIDPGDVPRLFLTVVADGIIEGVAVVIQKVDEPPDLVEITTAGDARRGGRKGSDGSHQD